MISSTCVTINGLCTHNTSVFKLYFKPISWYHQPVFFFFLSKIHITKRQNQDNAQEVHMSGSYATTKAIVSNTFVKQNTTMWHYNKIPTYIIFSTIHLPFNNSNPCIVCNRQIFITIKHNLYPHQPKIYFWILMIC